MTHGSDTSIKCPSCRKIIVKPLGKDSQGRDEKVTPGEIREFVVDCPYCGKKVHLWARWGIQVEAEREDKVR